jgi:hypothetical protein
MLCVRCGLHSSTVIVAASMHAITPCGGEVLRFMFQTSRAKYQMRHNVTPHRQSRVLNNVLLEAPDVKPCNISPPCSVARTAIGEHIAFTSPPFSPDFLNKGVRVRSLTIDSEPSYGRQSTIIYHTVVSKQRLKLSVSYMKFAYCLNCESQTISDR